jgi:hypothetical protein
MILKSIFNPITLVSIFAPILILQISFLKLKDVLGNSHYSSNPLYADLKSLVTSNAWADTLVDINIQYVVLLVAFLFAIIQSFSGLLSLLRNYNIGEVIDKWSDNSSALTYLIISTLMIIGGGVVFLTGTFMTPEQINLYRLNSNDPIFSFFGIHAPPLTSYIFIFRVLLSIYGVYLSFFIANILPKILNEKTN